MGLYALLSMCYILLLLECIDNHVTCAQNMDVFVYEWFAVIKVCQTQLYTLCCNKSNTISIDKSWLFKNLLDSSHKTIHTKWVPDLDGDRHDLVYP